MFNGRYGDTPRASATEEMTTGDVTTAAAIVRQDLFANFKFDPYFRRTRAYSEANVPLTPIAFVVLRGFRVT